MSEFKIEKGVPLPDIKLPRKWANLLKQMVIGDSVLVGTRNDTTAFHMAAKALNMKSVARAVEGGFRVWRVK